MKFENSETLLSAIGDGYWEWDILSERLEYSQTLLNMLGYSEDFSSQIDKPGLKRFISAQDFDHLANAFELHLAGRADRFSTDLQIRCGNGNYLWFSARGKIVAWSADHSPLRMIGTLTNLDQKLLFEKKLELYHAQGEFDRLMARLTGRISSYHYEDLDEIISLTLSELGKELGVDRSYLFLFDFAQETMSNTHEWCAPGTESAMGSLQNIPLSSFPWWMDQIKKGELILLEKLDEMPGEAQSERMVLSNQGIKSLMVVPLQAHGKSIGLLGFDCLHEYHVWQEYYQMLLIILAEAIANAIEGNNTRQLIQMNEARERLFIDAIPALIVRLSKQGKVIDYTVGCHGILSQYVSLHAPIQVNTLEDLFEKPIADEILQIMSISNEFFPNKVHEFEITVAGQITSLEMKYSVNKENENILVFQDISEKKNLEQLKNDFINNATHEMRTPLTTILLMIDLMEKTSELEKREQYWNILKGEVNRERYLIEELLSISRIEKGKFSGVRKQINICSSVRESVSIISPQAEGVGIRIIVDLPSEPVFIIGDANSCQTIFTNLLSNAVKFSSESENIDVKATKNDFGVSIEIRDHGIGILPEDLPKIFDRFYRGKNAVSEEILGSGIGLFLVQHLTQDMGGKVEVESQVGRGTKFTIFFPFQTTEKAKSEENSLVPL